MVDLAKQKEDNLIIHIKIAWEEVRVHVWVTNEASWRGELERGFLTCDRLVLEGLQLLSMNIMLITKITFSFLTCQFFCLIPP